MKLQFPRCRRLYATLALFPLLAAGCVGLSPEASQIYMVRNTQEVSACSRIGPVSAQSMACFDPSTCMMAASDEARNQAASMGATHLLRTHSGVNLTHGLFDGIAYRCAENKVGVQRMEMDTPPPPSIGCTKDVDCKGDRICEGGRCVAPLMTPTPSQP